MVVDMSFYTFLPKLLNMSLTGTIAILCVLLLRLLLKRVPKGITYALWAVVLFRLLCPVSVTSGLSLFGLLDAPSTSTVIGTNSMEYIPENIAHTEFPEVTIPVPGVSNTMNDTLPQGHEQLATDSLDTPVAIGDHVTSGNYVTVGNYVTIGTYVWLLGVIAMAAYSIISYVRLKRKLFIVSPLQDNIWLADEITTPFVMGLIRPKIYLPSDTEEHQMPYLIFHEKHHIRRGDHIFKALAFLALSIHWFNPLVWVAFIYAAKDMEMSCDEAVVKKLGEQILPDYAASLLSLATGRTIIAGVPLAFGEGDTKGRIRNLANWKRPAFWVVFAAVAACVILGVVLLTNPVTEELSESKEDRYYLLIGSEGVTSIEVITPNSSGGVINADGSVFKIGEKVWLEQLQGVRNLRGIAITAFGTDGNILYNFSVPENASPEVIMEMVESDSWLLVPTTFEVFYDEEITSEFAVADYREISYGEYQKQTGYDAEFYHSLYYIGELPDTELSIIFKAAYNEDLAEAVLSEDAKAIRLQGELSELFGNSAEQFSESELLKKISEKYGNIISIDYREGQENAYYVGNYYAHIVVEANAKDNKKTVFEIAAENQPEDEKMFSGSSAFWLSWENEETVKGNENVEDAAGYIWLSDTVFISELKDLDGNGIKEYVEVDIGDESTDFYSHLKFYWNDEAIYEYDDPCRIDPCEAKYIDLDGDGKKEIFFSFAPRVNSMPLMEYIVLKKVGSSWKVLEMIHGETMTDNAFPLSVTKGDTAWQAVISCENLDKTVTFDVEAHYLDLKRKLAYLSENGEETEFTAQLIERYENEFVDYPYGEICGNVSAWGIWNIEAGEYEGHPCLIATHGIQCYDKFDSWGETDVYFDYDKNGNTRFLDIQFRPLNRYPEQTEERIYEGETPGASYADIAEKYYTVGQYMKEVNDVSKAMFVAGDSYICEEYLAALGSQEPVTVYVLHDLNNDGIDEFFVGLKFNYDTPYYEIYDVYTWKDGRAYQLMRGIGYRNGSCRICENGVIEDNYSGSAWDWQVLYHILPKFGTKLETIDSVTSTLDDTVQIYYHGSDQADENTVQTIMEQYQPETVSYVECDAETIEQLRLSGKIAD